MQNATQNNKFNKSQKKLKLQERARVRTAATLRGEKWLVEQRELDLLVELAINQ